MELPDTLPECREGKAAFARFDAAMRRLATMPRAEYERREAEYQKQQRAKPNRPGPKPEKVKTSSSGRASRAKA
jgi:hypothetical protein